MKLLENMYRHNKLIRAFKVFREQAKAKLNTQKALNVYTLNTINKVIQSFKRCNLRNLLKTNTRK